MIARLKNLRGSIERWTGAGAILQEVAARPVAGRVRLAHALGAGVLFALALLIATGVTMAGIYAPSVTDAWGSVHHIQHEMTLGWWVRGLHHHAASALVVLTALYLSQVFLVAGHRAPRSFGWTMGTLFFLIALGTAGIGYHLPWDQNAYWGAVARMAIVETTPGGPWIADLLRGGDTLGNATLTRIYQLHAWVLPAGLVLTLWAHRRSVARHGLAPAAEGDRSEAYWPMQALWNGLFCVVLAGLLVSAAIFVGVSLEAPADPNSGYEARPEWFFLFLFELLHVFEGPMIVVGTAVIPALCVAFALGVPRLDRAGPPGRPALRWRVSWFGLFAAVVALTVYSVAKDGGNESYQEARAAAVEAQALAQRFAVEGGIDGDGRVVLFEGLRLFDDKGCASCHARDSDTPSPLLAGYGGVDRVDRFLENPDAEDFFGGTVLKTEMDPFDGDDEARRALALWLVSLSGAGPSGTPAQLARGPVLFEEHECGACHNDPAWTRAHPDYDDTADGPDLRGYQGFEWTRALIRDAHAPRLFGTIVSAEDRDDMMPTFEDLTDDELKLLVRWLMAGAPGAD